MIQQSTKAKNMFNKKVVQQALKNTGVLNSIPSITSGITPTDQSTLISQLIHDIFGGEILMTRKKKGWHFYNSINGEQIDFTISEKGNSPEKNTFKDLSSTPGKTLNSFINEDYSTFFIRFVMAFEEAVGLKKYPSAYTI
jgi:hypothetical protein